MMIQHIWQGKLIDDSQLQQCLNNLSEEIASTLNETLETENLLKACEDMSLKIERNELPELVQSLREEGFNNSDEVLNSLASFMKRSSLEKKLKSELGTVDPFKICRVDYKHPHYESWSPMGVLVHITAGNSPIVAPMAAIEGLLSGNINIIKIAGNSGRFPILFLKLLSEYFNIGKFVYTLRISSKQTDVLQRMIDVADCVSAWGGEEAIKSIREMTPQGIPVVAWGHKISFAYITPKALNQEVVDDLAYSICRNDQQSCSSPQCVFLDTDSRKEIDAFAQMLNEGLERARSKFPLPKPDTAQMAEITTVTQLHQAELCFEDGDVIEAPDYAHRILVSYTTKMMPSPLYRTIWVSPLKHNYLVDTLRSMRQYLQTAGLACDREELNELATLIYRAGVTRITPLKSMSISYTGEPHDGLFALPRFLKRVSFRTEMDLNNITSFDELKRKPLVSLQGQPIQGKKDYPPVPEKGTRIVMKSGGTTGEPVYCAYTENDYRNYIVNASVIGFMATGLDPEKDIVADLFKSGNLYGGMNCFISVFDEMKSPHLNVSGLDDFELAAKYIIKGKATALMGAPSYIVRLMKENEELFKMYGKINKIFYAGEPISVGQTDYLRNTFQIQHISSMIYGANETGTMGFVCKHTEPGVFHLSNEIQHLEILKMDSDEPVDKGEVGRLIFTGYKREAGHTERYEIGDLGQWVDHDCPCGRKQPLFRLLGRYGDVMRLGGTFFNYARISKILSEAINYSGRLQLLIDKDEDSDIMIFCLENVQLTKGELIEMLMGSDYDSFHKTIPSKLLRVELNVIDPKDFQMNEISLKLRPIIYLNKGH